MNIISRVKAKLTNYQDVVTQFESPISENFQEIACSIDDYIRRLSPSEIKKRNSDITVPLVNKSINEVKVLDTLEKFGVVIIPNFIDAKVLSKLNKHFFDILKRTSFDKNNENKDVRVVVGKDDELPTYQHLAKYPKPVFTLRTGEDKGMIDAFNLEKFELDEVSQIYKSLSTTKLTKIASSCDPGLSPANLNLYYNKAVLTTCGFHHDGFRDTLKLFVYGMDVVSLSDGPYCYVKGSHADSPWRAANMIVSRSWGKPLETPMIELRNICPILAKKGSLIISNQAGSHKGFPQSKGGERLLYVLRYNYA